MKTKGLMLLAAMLMITVVLVGCKKKEQPVPAQAPTVEEIKKTAAEAAAQIEQTMCPVMDGNPINKDVFVEYKGVKVYFCCSSCKAKFEADPEKYTANLPQFKN
jgi:YHS domain-containing protein